MFRVIVTEERSDGTTPKGMDLCIKTEKLYELLGRYQVKYGAPETLASKDGVTTIEHYKVLPDSEHICVTIAYARYSKDVKIVKKKEDRVASSKEVSHVNRTYDRGYAAWQNYGNTSYNSTVDATIKDERFEELVASGAMTARSY